MHLNLRRNLPVFGLALALAVPTVATVAARRVQKPALAAPTRREAARQSLHDAMRKLWTDHVVWTREYVVAAIDGSASAGAAATRLMKNQEDIGHALAPFYGAAAGDSLTALLKQHISIAVDLVNAAKAGDQRAFEGANAKWKQNAADIAALLANANPRWPEASLAEAMSMHLETTAREVTARLHKEYDADVAAFDAVYEHMLHVADTLSDGIVQQFPERFAE